MTKNERQVAAHYDPEDLGEKILAALEKLGCDLDALTPKDLAPVDAFHIRGIEATRELAALADLGPGLRLVDVGSGLGGTARHLASEHGCHVSGVDLSEEYCRVATMLSQRTALGERTEFHHASALDLPFPDGRFDVAWTEHVQMNIPDKAAFYREIGRVLQPGGTLVFHDVFQGDGGEALFPVPWAGDDSISFLIGPGEARTLLGSLGFRERHWVDRTAESAAWFERAVRWVAAHGTPPLGIHLVMGSDTLARMRNISRNLAEGRVTVIQAALEKETGS
jgi:ubiquinone/menaquinone biosynthesis C-methylase UbiE